MANENQENQGTADKAVDKAQEKSSGEGKQGQASGAAEKAQDKGLVQKAEDKIKEKFGKGNS